MAKSHASCLSKSKGKLLNNDKFSEGFQMKLNDGKSAVPSWMGSICTILLLTVMLSYTY